MTTMQRRDSGETDRLSDRHGSIDNRFIGSRRTREDDQIVALVIGGVAVHKDCAPKGRIPSEEIPRAEAGDEQCGVCRKDLA